MIDKPAVGGLTRRMPSNMLSFQAKPAGAAMVFRVVANLILALIIGGSIYSPSQREYQPDPPIGFSDFGRLISSLSEPEGYFDSDNFVSNEAAYLRIIPAFRRLGLHGGAYVGVGPDQNYSYIAEVRPELALIVDIRRQNALQHLYYKALFQLSSSRVEYLEHLFGRPIKSRVKNPSGAKITELLHYVDISPRDKSYMAARMSDVLQAIHAWNLELPAEDYDAIQYVAKAFMDGGPDLKFTSYNRAPRPHHPTYRRLLEETDFNGNQVNYLAEEQRYQAVKKLQAENRIIPVVGDLGGTAAMQRMISEIRHRHLEVKCFYVSNVEFYLFGGERWESYVRNLRSIPWAPDAYIIRSYANMWQPHPAQVPGYYMTTVLQPVQAFLANESTGKNETYWDLVTHDYVIR